MRALSCAVLLLLVVVPGSADAEIATLSTRPDMVTGGDVLVRVPEASVVRVNGRVEPGHGRTRLIDGLRLGRNTITAAHDRLTVINHPITGPVFSGPHEQPFVCETESAGLGAPLDDDCSIATRTETRANGVRVETGTINRGIYEIAVPPNWNGRLIYTFGGGCIGGWYRQGPHTGGVTDDFMLANGYALASSSLNVFGNNCNDLIAAETMMMVKERFIEAYGPPAHTQGWGCSGGSYAAAPDRRQLSRACSTASSRAALPRRRLRHDPRSSPTPGCSTTTSTAPTSALDTTSRSARSPASLNYNDGAERRGRRAPHRSDAEFCDVVPRCRRSATTRSTNPTGVRCDRVRPHGQRLRPRSRQPGSRAGRSTTSASSTA